MSHHKRRFFLAQQVLTRDYWGMGKQFYMGVTIHVGSRTSAFHCVRNSSIYGRIVSFPSVQDFLMDLYPVAAICGLLNGARHIVGIHVLHPGIFDNSWVYRLHFIRLNQEAEMKECSKDLP